MKFKSTKTDGNVTVYGLGDDEDLIINGIGNFSGAYFVPGGVTLMRISRPVRRMLVMQLLSSRRLARTLARA